MAKWVSAFRAETSFLPGKSTAFFLCIFNLHVICLRHVSLWHSINCRYHTLNKPDGIMVSFIAQLIYPINKVHELFRHRSPSFQVCPSVCRKWKLRSVSPRWWRPARLTTEYRRKWTRRESALRRSTAAMGWCCRRSGSRCKSRCGEPGS